ncbi:hypothetical protein [Bradyrhizobium sp.]|uniref:hypothetical protein n=1 Tax=Bradyrhizobium sp. TaxID=376 RepID=UPI001ED3515A|nr:hypothetical protein [Bradyrhizobium sp.]MBV9984988.1 hypothetical protein [Bradyrhizobium sp.]
MPEDRKPVSPQNPCPFLRALVAEGLLSDQYEPLKHLSDTIRTVARTGDGTAELHATPIILIALVANGLSPLQLVRTRVHGVHLSALRGGPLDKKGAGSGILDQSSRFDQSQLDRMATFGSEKVDANGNTEIGLNLAEITKFMNANFARAKGRRRLIDRRLMDGEFPILLRVMGKQGRDARYLSIAELKTLFAERRLPERMLRPLG